MSWDTKMPELVRNLLFDLDTTQTYSDDTLLRVLVSAAFRVSSELLFDNSFVADLDNQTIAPDPTVTATQDDSFVNLTCLQAAAIIERGEAARAAKQGIFVKDGSSAIDLRGVAIGRLQLIGKGWNDVYDKAKFQYQLERSALAGRMITGPTGVYQDRVNV